MEIEFLYFVVQSTFSVLFFEILFHEAKF